MGQREVNLTQAVATADANFNSADANEQDAIVIAKKEKKAAQAKHDARTLELEAERTRHVDDLKAATKLTVSAIDRALRVKKASLDDMLLLITKISRMLKAQHATQGPAAEQSQRLDQNDPEKETSSTGPNSENLVEEEKKNQQPDTLQESHPSAEEIDAKKGTEDDDF